MRINFKFIIRIILGVGLAGILFVLGVQLRVRTLTNHYIVNMSDQVPESQAALVLGARVYNDGKLSPVLEDRVVKALELYNAGKIEKIAD